MNKLTEIQIDVKLNDIIIVENATRYSIQGEMEIRGDKFDVSGERLALANKNYELKYIKKDIEGNNKRNSMSLFVEFPFDYIKGGEIYHSTVEGEIIDKKNNIFRSVKIVFNLINLDEVILAVNNYKLTKKNPEKEMDDFLESLSSDKSLLKQFFEGIK